MIILESLLMKRDLFLTGVLNQEGLDKLNSIYISYFIAWNSFKNDEFARKCGLMISSMNRRELIM